jgi:hypothetical protein
MTAPYVQINAEASGQGDHLSARLLPIKTVSGAAVLSAPTCGFTTRGIEVHRAHHSALVFAGTYQNYARVTYVSLEDGTTGDTCEAVDR